MRKQLTSGTKYQKKYVLPKHEWAHSLREETWSKKKIPCSFAFQTHSIKYGEQITCFGQCTECSAGIKIVIEWLTDNIAHCKGMIMGYDPKFKHNPLKKIKMSPFKRNELACELKHKSSIVVRNELIDSAMNVGDTEPSHIPTTACLRQIKYEPRCNEHYHENPVLALWIMSKISPFEIIRHISLFPFYVYYWSSAQDQHYKKYSRQNRVILSLDATGSLLKEVGPTKDITNTNHIFLYSGVMYDENNGRSVSITQMLSEIHNMDTIFRWIQTWKDNKKCPNEVVLDHSPALVGAAVKAFTSFKSTAEYLANSFE